MKLAWGVSASAPVLEAANEWPLNVSLTTREEAGPG
jgi:hypothetical protein